MQQKRVKILKIKKKNFFFEKFSEIQINELYKNLFKLLLNDKNLKQNQIKRLNFLVLLESTEKKIKNIRKLIKNDFKEYTEFKNYIEKIKILILKFTKFIEEIEKIKTTTSYYDICTIWEFLEAFRYF
jgi:molecular chaperone DnaK (HSP70)